ncbi:MAG TPA: hypothetical protein VN982_04640 [Candidatus Dormibacteraeota bacterium]|nr:hypothetical protein [Candidatus Dormibacteraeota bacterium]
MKMNTLQNKSLRMRWLGSVVSLGLTVFAGIASPTLANETVQGDAVNGKFTLPMQARLGNTVLPAGNYKFSVITVGSIRSVSSIQTGNRLVQVVVWSLAKGGPLANMFATASKESDITDPKPLDIREDENGMTIHSMWLEKLGMVIEFNGNKPNNVMRARAPEPQQAVASAKGSD